MHRLQIKVTKKNSDHFLQNEKDKDVEGKIFYREKTFFTDKLKLMLYIKLEDGYVCLTFKVIEMPYLRGELREFRLFKGRSDRQTNFRINQIHCDIQVKVDWDDVRKIEDYDDIERNGIHLYHPFEEKIYQCITYTPSLLTAAEESENEYVRTKGHLLPQLYARVTMSVLVIK
jgi:hypothetical protein